MSLNLHALVRQSITANYADQTFTLYLAAGQGNVKGVITQTYRKITGITGNFQSEGDAALAHAEMAAQNTIIRRLYLYADPAVSSRPWSVYRPLGRGGDYVQDAKGQYWLVVAVLEDFSDAGWECLRVQFQQVEPVLTVIDDETEGA